MQTVYKSIKVLLFLSFNLSLIGQESATPAIGSIAPASGTSAPNTAGLTDFLDNQNILNLSNNLLDPNSDSVDPENGILQWKGKTFAMDQNYPFRSRFERYLSMPTPEPEVYDQYSKMFFEMKNLLSIENTNVENRKKSMGIINRSFQESIR